MKIFGKWIFAVIFFICMLTPATVMTVSADDGIEPEAANAIETEVTQDVPDVITEEVNATVTGNDKEEYVSDQKSGISETVSLNTESTCGKDGEEAVNDSVLTEENSSSIEEGVSVTEVSSDDSEKADDEFISQNNTDEASNESTESVAEGESQQENECNDQQKAGSAIAMEEPSTATNTVADNPILEKSDIPANAPLMASANGSMISDYEYIVDDDQVTITKYNGLASVLNLPEEITGYSVTGIDPFAFECNTELTSIDIPASVCYIGYRAFAGCESLETVIFHENNGYIPGTHDRFSLSIGASAFEGCISLTELSLPESVTVLGDGFINGTGITTITLPKNLTDASLALYGSRVEEVVFADGMERIPNGVCDADEGLSFIQSVVIPETVTEIGAEAFHQCVSLYEIELPNSLREIEDHAFNGCTGLSSIDIPASVFYIGGYAFAGCESLETVTFHENNGYMPGTNDRFSLSIGNYAFSGCTSLTGLEFPESLTELGGGFINGTGITTITLPRNLTDASCALSGSIVEEVIFADGMERVPDGVCDAIYNEPVLVQSVVIPETVTRIGAYAFRQCVRLQEIELPNSLSEIENDAFEGCTGLSSIDLPASLREIEDNAFEGCTGLSSIDLPASVYYIGGYAFADCESLETVVFHENNGYMPGTTDRFSLSIGNYSFSGCTSLTGLVFPESLTGLGCGFINNTGITTITLPKNLTDASGALSGSIVEEVIFADGMERIPNAVCDANGESSFIESVVIPETVTDIGACAFSECISLYEIELPNSLREIENDAFEGCTGLSSIDIPASVYYIGGYAFAGCESLETVIFHENNGYMPGTTDRFSLSIGGYAFEGCTSLTGLVFPESLTELGCGFIENTGITTITLPRNLTDASCALRGSIVEEVIFADGMERIPDGVCNAEEGSSFIQFVVIPETVTDIGSEAFRQCINLHEIELPNSLREIEGSAFNGCTGLSSIVIPETVTDIGAGAFSQCVSLYEIELPNSLREIEGRTFCGCTGLSSIVIPETVTRIGGEAFSQCVSLYEIELPNWLREIDYESFNGCTGLSSIDIPASVYYIGHSAFADCESLETVVFHENNGYMPGTTDRFSLRIMDSAFSGCTSLTGLVFPESLTELGSESLRNTGITTITLPRNLTYAYNALMGSIVEEVIFADGMTCIPDQVCNAWGEPSYIQTVVIPDTVTRIGDAVFMNCEALSDIYFEGSEIRWNSIDKESAEIPDGTVIHFLETPVKILEILTLSDDYYGKNGTQAAFHIEALGTGDLTYQWQYKTAGSNTWKSPSQASAKTADYTFNLKPSYDNIEVRCIVSDGDGNELISETRKANVFAVTAQPADAAAGIGETVVFNVSAIGKGLVYQWYFMRPSGNWKKATVAGSNTDTLSITGSTANNGTSYRCLVSDSEGNSITSSAAVLTISEILKITGLSDDWYGPDGTSAGFHVEASGSTTLSYQWQYKLAGETKWRTPGQASAKSTDYSFKMKPSYDNIEVRCIVKDASGNEVTSDTRKANVFAITAQPTDITAVEDQNVNFEVSAIGRNVTYQWYYKRPNGTWKKTTKAGSTTAVLPITAGTINDGTSYRCVITDEEGNQLTSAAGFLTLDISLKITGLSENAYDMNGSNVTFHVDAAGNGDLSYQWQYKLAGETRWRTPSQASAKTADYAFKLRPSYDNIEVRCIVTDDSGSSVISDVRKANVFAITSQPQDAELALGEQATFAVEAIGKDLAYQWYYMRPEGSWKKVTMTGYNTAALVITANTKNDGTKYRCHITDGLGNVIVSAAATLTQT